MSKSLIIVSRFNEFISRNLLSGAQQAYVDAGLTEDDYDILWTPGCFEIPGLAATAARSNTYGSIVCLGSVIRGETPHFDYVAGEAASGLMRVSVETGVPVIFGILTTDNAEQALARCGIKTGNKGREAVQTALEMMKTRSQLIEMTNN